MTLQQKIELNEKSVKARMELLRNSLNELSKVQKTNPNDWRYLTALALTDKALEELIQQIR